MNQSREALRSVAGIRMQFKEGLKKIAFGQSEGKTPEEVNREFHDNDDLTDLIAFLKTLP